LPPAHRKGTTGRLWRHHAGSEFFPCLVSPCPRIIAFTVMNTSLSVAAYYLIPEPARLGEKPAERQVTLSERVTPNRTTDYADN